MLLRVTFDDGQSRDIPLTTAHALWAVDSTGTTDAVAVDGVAALELVLGETPTAPAVDAPAWDATTNAAGLEVAGEDVAAEPAEAAVEPEPVIGHHGAVLTEPGQPALTPDEAAAA